jgi:hypothetical protein
VINDHFQCQELHAGTMWLHEEQCHPGKTSPGFSAAAAVTILAQMTTRPLTAIEH